MAYNITISVKVNNEVVFLSHSDPRHQFTVAELIEACHEYGIPVDNGRLTLNGSEVASNAQVTDGQNYSIAFQKGKDGQAC